VPGRRGKNRRARTFDPVTLVVPAINAICKKSKATAGGGVAHLWSSAAEFLLQRSETRPPPPSDWCLNVKLSCLCPDCRELQSFANDPELRIHRFRVNKVRRSHLHQVIDRARLDMTHITERVGSPQTLVCTKDRRTFDQRMKDYRDEIAAMRTLAGLASQSGGSAALATRMELAVTRGAD
jgi:hypothetical protein